MTPVAEKHGTEIEWTHQPGFKGETWNPIRGCSMAKGSEDGECLNCYAARFAARGLPGHNSPTTGKPFAILRDSGPRWTGEVELIEHMLDLPLRWKSPRSIFVNSMSDLFHERLSDESIDRVFAVMALASQHRHLILTKRPDRMLRWAEDGYCGDKIDCTLGYPEFRKYNPKPLQGKGPLPNVWLGTSVGLARNEHRIDSLRNTPAAVRFLSLEPLLEDIGELDLTGIHWVIVGGESGPGARPLNVAWVRNIINQCWIAKVPCFVKQLGAKPEETVTAPRDGHKWIRRIVLKDRKGGDWSEWPEDLRVREYPEAE